MDDVGFIYEAFNSSVCTRSYKRGAHIYQEGAVAGSVFRLLQGRVKLWKEGYHISRNIIFQIVYPFDLFGLLDFFNQKRIRRCTAVAVDNEVIVQCIPFHEFEKKILKHSNNRYLITLSLMKRYHNIWEKYCKLQLPDINRMVFKTLESLAKEKGEITPKGIVLEGMTHQELADYIGVSRQSVTTAMNTLRSEKRIDYNRYQIVIRFLNEK